MHVCLRRIRLWRLFPGVLCPYSLVWAAPKSKSFLYALACFISRYPSLVLVGFVGAQEQARLFQYVGCLASCVHLASSCSFRPLMCCILRDGLVIVLPRTCMGTLFSWQVHTSPRRNIPQHRLSPLRGLVHVNGRIRFGSAMPTCMGDRKSLEAGGALVEVKWKWMWLR